MEVIANLTIYDLAEYFDLKLEDASNIVGVGSSKLKEICRDAGLKKWPYRTVSSLYFQINTS